VVVVLGAAELVEALGAADLVAVLEATDFVVVLKTADLVVFFGVAKLRCGHGIADFVMVSEQRCSRVSILRGICWSSKRRWRNERRRRAAYLVEA